MAEEPTNKTSTEYVKIKAVKGSMSQMFNSDSQVIPYTELILQNKDDLKIIEQIESGSKIRIIGKSKGKGYAGVVKLWGFRAGPNTHGQVKARSGGSIGTQGQRRVIPGKKMAGRMGNKKVTTITELVSVDQSRSVVSVKGGIPGSRNSAIVLLIHKQNEN